MTAAAALSQMAAWEKRTFEFSVTTKGNEWVLACLLDPASWQDEDTWIRDCLMNPLTWRVDEAQAQELLRIQVESLR